MAELGARLAAGGSSELFEFGPGRVLKLFRREYAYIADVEEARTRAVFAAGVACPEVLGRATFDGRPGLILEQLRGPTLLAEAARPETAALLARLHAELHQAPCAALPSWRVLVKRVERSLHAADAARYRDLVARAPEGERIYHGDFHPGNVIRSERGLAIVDWPNACLAHPGADVARSLVLMRYQGLRAETERRAADARRAFSAAYLSAYLALGAASWSDVAAALPLAAAGVLRGEPGNAAAPELARIVMGDTDALAP